MFGYYIPAPDEALLITGGKSTQGTVGRIVVGHGAWVMPFFRKVRRLQLGTRSVDLAELVQTKHGINVNVTAVVAFKVGAGNEAIAAAAERMISEQGGDEIEKLAKEIFTGHLRNIVGTMTIEEIIQEREKLAKEVLEGSQAECSNFGLHVDSLQIKSIDDDGTGYIDALSQPQRAVVKQNAAVAQAEADRVIAENQQNSLRKQAEYARDTQLLQAQYQAEVDQQNASAAQSGPLAQAKAEQEVIEMRSQLAERNAALRERELVAEVIKPAEAEAERLRIVADGQAKAAENERKVVETRAQASATQTKVEATARAEATKVAALADAERVRVAGVAEGQADEAKANGVKALKLADAEGIRAQKLAEAEGALKLAEAQGAHNEVQVKMRQIEIQPQIAKAIADGINLGGAKGLYVFNGAEGLTQLLGAAIPLVTGLIGQLKGEDSPRVPAIVPTNGAVATPESVSV